MLGPMRALLSGPPSGPISGPMRGPISGPMRASVRGAVLLPGGRSGAASVGRMALAASGLAVAGRLSMTPAWAAAPSFDLFGAFFPAWLACGVAGIFAALLCRKVFVVIGLDAILALRFFVYVAVGVAVAGLGWLLCFGPAP